MRKFQIEKEETTNHEFTFLVNKEKRTAPQIFTSRWFEVITAIMLGMVAVATAWSGYEATRWDGEQSIRYTQANALRVESIRNSTLAGEYVLYDNNLFSNWLSSFSQGNTKLASLYEKRFRPEFRAAFSAWLATKPFDNSHAPPAPFTMPQYKVSLSEKANQLAIAADREFNIGEEANDHGDEYTLNTVFLASVLFLTALGDRFDWNGVRAVTLIFALGLFLFSVYHLIKYPII